MSATGSLPVLVSVLSSAETIGAQRPVVLLVLPLALVVLGALMFVRTGEGAPGRRGKLALFGSRALLIVCLVVAAAGPYLLVVEETTADPEVHMLVDESGSMDVYDVDPEDIAADIEAQGVPVRTTTVGDETDSPIGDQLIASLREEGHLLVLSDGQVTEGTGLAVAADVAYDTNATVSALELEADRAERAVTLDTPAKTSAGVEETFVAEIHGVGETSVGLTVSVDGEQIHTEQVSGTERVELTHTFEEAGDHRVTASIDGVGFDRNTEFHRSVRVVEPPEVLYVSRVDYPLETFLETPYNVTRAEAIPDRSELEEYYAVVVQDVAAGDLGDVGALQSYATEGNGVVVVGGQNAYERGGYEQSPIASMLPVQFEDSIGSDDIVLLVDISGSADLEMPRIRGLSLDVLESIDNESRLGIVAFDRSTYTLAELQPLEGNRAELEETIKRMEPGGGTEIDTGLYGAAELLDDGGEVILITDGRDGRERSMAAARELAAQDIRLTSVGVTERRFDDLMADMATETGGTYFTPDDTEQLRLLFNEDAEAPEGEGLVVLDETHFVTRDVELEADPGLTNDVEPRRGARRLVIADDGSPAVTAWRFGLGRVVSVTAYNDDGSLGELLTEPDSAVLTRSVNWAIGDPERKTTGIADVGDTRVGEETTAVYRGASRPDTESFRFARVDADRYEASITPTEPGYREVLGTEYAVNYPREYTTFGQSTALDDAVAHTGGERFGPDEAAAVAEFTVSVATEERLITHNLAWAFLLVGLLVYLVEVATRRLQEVYTAGPSNES